MVEHPNSECSWQCDSGDECSVSSLERNEGDDASASINNIDHSDIAENNQDNLTVAQESQGPDKLEEAGNAWDVLVEARSANNEQKDQLPFQQQHPTTYFAGEVKTSRESGGDCVPDQDPYNEDQAQTVLLERKEDQQQQRLEEDIMMVDEVDLQSARPTPVVHMDTMAMMAQESGDFPDQVELVLECSMDNTGNANVDGLGSSFNEQNDPPLEDDPMLVDDEFKNLLDEQKDQALSFNAMQVDDGVRPSVPDPSVYVQEPAPHALLSTSFGVTHDVAEPEAVVNVPMQVDPHPTHLEVVEEKTQEPRDSLTNQDVTLPSESVAGSTNSEQMQEMNQSVHSNPTPENCENSDPSHSTPSLDLEKLCCLLETTNEVGNTLANQDVLLFIGATGSGKSTTVLYLAGTKFEEIEVDGFDHYAPVTFPKAELETFKVAPGGQSATRTIQTTSIEVNGKRILLADSPGFNDSDGVEVDIANGWGLIRALQRAKSVKPVLVFNVEGLSDRFRSLSDTLDTVIRMMGTEKAVDCETFEYIFTRCTSKESKRVHRKLAAFQKSLVEKHGNCSLLHSLHENMIQKTTPCALFVDPMDENYLAVLHELCSDETSGFIRPQAFCPFLTPTASNILYSELEHQTAKLEKDLQLLNFEAIEQTLHLLARLVAALPEQFIVYLERASSSVKAFILLIKERVVLLIQSLWKYDFRTRGSYTSILEHALSELTALMNIGSLCTICRLKDDVNPTQFLPGLFDELFKKRPSFQVNLSEAEMLKWSLSQLNDVAKTFENFPGGSVFRFKLLEDFDRLSCYVIECLNNADNEIKGSVGGIPMVEKYIVFADSMARFLKAHGMSDSEGKLVFDENLESTVDTLRKHTGTLECRVQAVARNLMAILHAQSDIMCACFDQLNDIVEPREFLVAFASAQSLLKLTGIEPAQILKSIALLDKEANCFLHRFSALASAEVEVLKNGTSNIDDLASIRERVHQLIGKVEEGAGACAAIRSWTSFDSSKSDETKRLTKRLDEYANVMKLIIASLDEQAAAMVKDLAEATRVARQFQSRLAKGEGDLSFVVTELCEPQNWNRWQSFVAMENEKGHFSRLSGWFLNPFGRKSCSVHHLSDAMTKIVSKLHTHLVASLKRLSSNAENDYSCPLMVDLPDACLLLSFLRVSKASSLGKRIINQESASQFGCLVTNAFNGLIQALRAFVRMPKALFAARRYGDINNLLNYVKESQYGIHVLISFANEVPTAGVMFDKICEGINEYKDLVAKMPRYKPICSNAAEAIDSLSAEVERISLLPALNLCNETDREHFYDGVANTLEATREIRVLGAHVSEDLRKDLLSQMYQHALEHIQNGLRAFHQILLGLIRTFPEDEDSFSLIHKYCSNLASFDRCFRERKRNLADLASELLEECCQKKNPSLSDIKSNAKDLNPSELATLLVRLKKAAREIHGWSSEMNHCIDRCLSHCGGSLLLELTLQLRGIRGDDAVVVEQILSDHSIFNGITASLFAEATKGQGIGYVLKGLDLTPVESEKLERMYNIFDAEYTSLVMDGLTAIRSVDEPSLKDSSVTFKAQLVRKCLENVADLSVDYSAQVVSLTALLFAHWSLTGMSDIVLADNSPSLSTYLRKPHAAQVIACWVMLNCHSANEFHHLGHHMVELYTGEGKSIVLGVVAAILALWGYNVDVVCYSAYLSERDSSAFKELFSDFGVAQRVWYGTIKSLAERVLGDSYRDLVARALKDSSFVSSKSCTPPRILLVDEVDIFFGDKVFGGQLCPVWCYSSASLSKLFLSLWKASEDLDTSSIMDSSDAQAFLSELPTPLQAIFRKNLEGMKDDARCVRQGFSKPYFVVGNEIAYKYFDGVCTWLKCSSQTAFVYVKEWENGNITKTSMERNLEFIVGCGQLSYAELPFCYHIILGITGTLRALVPEQRAALAQMYGITSFSYIPSVFGERKNFQFDRNSGKDVKLCHTQDDFFFELKQEIVRRRRESSEEVAIHPPVMVFFDSQQTLLAFYDSSVMKAFKEKSRVITVTTPQSEKDGLFLKATELGAITLMMREFGRGTDFKCFDRGARENGGVHVIQAFFSSEVAEEIQIQGRTARQGVAGSFSMVLNAEDIKRNFQVTQEEITTASNAELYSFLAAKRESLYNSKVGKRQAQVAGLENMHYRTLACKEALEKGNKTKRQEIIRFVNGFNGLGDSNAFQEHGMKAAMISKRKDEYEKFKQDDQKRRQKAKDKKLLRVEASNDDQERAKVRERLKCESLVLYDVLGVASNAKEGSIKYAYHHLSKLFHPDKCKDDDAAEIFRKVKDAYDVLSCADKRAAYDAEHVR